MKQEHVVLKREVRSALPVLQEYFSCTEIEPIFGFALLVLDTMSQEVSSGWLIGSCDARTGVTRTLTFSYFSPDMENLSVPPEARYRVCITDEAWAVLEQLKLRLSVQKIDTLFEIGISLLRWAVEERKAGRAFGSHHEQSRCFKEVLFPPRLGGDDDSGRRRPPTPPTDPISPSGFPLEPEITKA